MKPKFFYCTSVFILFLSFANAQKSYKPIFVLKSVPEKQQPAQLLFSTANFNVFELPQDKMKCVAPKDIVITMPNAYQNLYYENNIPNAATIHKLIPNINGFYQNPLKSAYNYTLLWDELSWPNTAGR